MSLPAVLFCLLVAQTAPQQSSTAATGAAVQASDPPQAAPGADDLPVSLKRIQRALEQAPALKILDPKIVNGRPVFRMDVEGEKIDIVTLLGKDSLRGNASYGGMTHQEFLDLVTPNDVKGYAAFSNTEGLMVAATSIALQWAVLKAFDALKKAKDAHEQEAARKEVQDALEALRKAREAAGLPDK
jgi:hypothetical protein